MPKTIKRASMRRPDWQFAVDGEIAILRKNARARAKAALVLCAVGFAAIAVYLLDPTLRFRFLVFRQLPGVILLWGGSGLLCCAILNALRRDAVVFDRSKKQICSVRRVIWTFRCRTIPLDQLAAIEIVATVQLQDTPAFMLFRVTVKDGNHVMELVASRDSKDAFHLAKQAAIFLNIPIHFRTESETIEYAPQTLLENDLSRNLGFHFDGGRRAETVLRPTNDFPEPPAETQVQFDSQGNALTLRFPEEGRRWQKHRVIAFWSYLLPFGLVFFVIVPWALSKRGNPGIEPDDSLQRSMTALFLVGISLFWLHHFWVGKTRFTLELHPDHLFVQRHRPLESQNWRFQYNGLQATIAHPQTQSLLDAPPKNLNFAITLIDQEKSCQFGRVMTQAEAYWVFDLINFMIQTSEKRSQPQTIINISAPTWSGQNFMQ